MREGKLPFPSGAVLRALHQYLGREHAVDLEKLEFDRIAAGIGGGIHKGLGARKVPAVIAGCLGDKKRSGRMRGHLLFLKPVWLKSR